MCTSEYKSNGFIQTVGSLFENCGFILMMKNIMGFVSTMSKDGSISFIFNVFHTIVYCDYLIMSKNSFIYCVNKFNRFCSTAEGFMYLFYFPSLYSWTDFTQGVT